MPGWLDSWTTTRYLNQQELAKRWALRGTPEAEEKPLPAEPPVAVPYGHSIYILKHGKKAYRRWVIAGCPDKEARAVCPVLSMVSQFFVDRRYGVWKSHSQ